MPPMSLDTNTPISYLITNGRTTRATHPASEEFRRILALVEQAVAARISLVQLREKELHTRVLYELAVRAAALTRGSTTRLVVNDRADLARAAGCDGVHLTVQSLEAAVVRRAFGKDFLVGVSAHSLHEARAARDGGANFATFGPVFDTPSKRPYGPPAGLEALKDAARTLAPFPLLALGGVTLESAGAALRAGASGVAAIRLFGDARQLDATVRRLRAV